MQINAQKSTKPAILIDAACHAREWISPASVMFFTEVCMSVVNIFVDIFVDIFDILYDCLESCKVIKKRGQKI